jgi:hypothetical protein
MKVPSSLSSPSPDSPIKPAFVSVGIINISFITHFVDQPENISPEDVTKLLRFLNFCNENHDVILEDEVLKKMERFCETVKVGLLTTDEERGRIDEIKNYFTLLVDLMASRRSESESVSQGKEVNSTEYQTAVAMDDSQFADTVFSPTVSQDGVDGSVLPGTPTEEKLPATGETSLPASGSTESKSPKGPVEREPRTIEWAEAKLLYFIEQGDGIKLNSTTSEEFLEIERVILQQKNGGEVLNFQDEERLAQGLARLTESVEAVEARVTVLKSRMVYIERFAGDQVLMSLSRIRSHLATLTPRGVDGERALLPSADINNIREARTEPTNPPLSAPAIASEPLAMPNAPLSNAERENDKEEIGKRVGLELAKLAGFMREGNSLPHEGEVEKLLLGSGLAYADIISLIDKQVIADFLIVISEQRERIAKEREIAGGTITPEKTAYDNSQLKRLEKLEIIFSVSSTDGSPLDGEISEIPQEIEGEVRLAERKEGVFVRGGRVMRSALSFGSRLAKQSYEKVKPVVVETAKSVANKLLASARFIGTVASSIDDGVSMVKDPSIVKRMSNEATFVRVQEERKRRGEAVDDNFTLRGENSEEMLARQRVWNRIEVASDAYNKLDPKIKLLIGGALIAVGFVGSAPVATVAYGGRVVLRGLGAYSAGKGAEEMYRKKAMSNWIYSASDSSLSEDDFLKRGEQIEKNAKRIKWSFGIGAFLVGSLADMAHLFDSDAIQVVSEISVAPDDVPAYPAGELGGNLSLQGQVFSETLVAPHNYLDAVELEASGGVPDVLPFDGLLQVVSGQGLTEMLLSNSDALQMLTGGTELSEAGMKNYVANILGNLSGEQLREVGITSGNADLLSLSDKIKVEKLSGIAQTMKIQLTDSSPLMSLLDRAKMF